MGNARSTRSGRNSLKPEKLAPVTYGPHSMRSVGICQFQMAISFLVLIGATHVQLSGLQQVGRMIL